MDATFGTQTCCTNKGSYMTLPLLVSGSMNMCESAARWGNVAQLVSAPWSLSVSRSTPVMPGQHCLYLLQS